MSLDACAALLRAHDPERFAICLLADPKARPRLLTLYALNLELARAPLASNEPLIAEIRLQWWIERLEAIGQGHRPAHELLGPLAEAWGNRAGAFAALAEPRRRDAAREPHEGPGAVAAYVRGTAVALALFAAEALAGEAAGGMGAPPEPLPKPGEFPSPLTPSDPPVAGEGQPDLFPGVRTPRVFSEPGHIAGSNVIALQAEGLGLVAWLGALPALQGMGLGLRDPSPEILGQIAAMARARLAEARAARRAVSRRMAPVLFSGAAVAAVLDAAPKGIEALAGAQVSEFRKRLAMMRFALTHRWW